MKDDRPELILSRKEIVEEREGKKRKKSSNPNANSKKKNRK